MESNQLSIINKLIDLLRADMYAKTVVVGYEYYQILLQHYSTATGLGFETVSKELRFMGRTLKVNRDEPYALELY